MMKRLALAAVISGAATATPVWGADGITVELNKLTPVEGACRVYMVFTNGGDVALDSYKPDLVFFGKDGVIRKRLVVEGGPLAAGKTKVKLFDASDIDCADIGRILLNDVAACDGPGQSPVGCLAATETVARGDVKFIK